MLNNLEKRLRWIADSTFIGLLLVIMIVRVGPSPIGKPWVGWVYDAARVFPKTTSYLSYSPLPVLIAKTIGEPRTLVWWGLFGLILILWFVAVMRRLRDLFPDHYRIVQIIFAASQVVMLETTHIGHYDNISVIAASLVFLWDSTWLIYIGALLAAGANSYMSFATGICVLVLYLGTKEKRHLKIGAIWTIVSAAMLIGLHVWLNGPASNTRENIVLHQVGSVVKGAFGVWSFIFLAVLGPLWFLYVWLIAQPEWSFGPVTKFRKLCVIKGTVIIPMLMSFFILDHTRIDVVVGGLPLFLYLLPELKLHLKRIGSLKEFKFPVLSTMLIVWIIYPAIIVDNAGVFRLPYAKFISLVSGG